MFLETNPSAPEAPPPFQRSQTARIPSFAAAHIIILMAAVMVAISAAYGLLPQV